MNERDALRSEIDGLRRDIAIKDAALRYVKQFLDEYDVGHELHPSLRRKVERAIAAECLEAASA